MAGLMVGGAFLGSFLNVVFDKLASPEVVKFIRGEKLLVQLLERLKTTLIVVRAVLNDAEKRQIRDSDVKDWLDELKHVVYMADDLLDEVATKAAIAATQKEVTTSNFFSGLSNVAPDADMATRLTKIVDKLEYILKLKESLDLKEIAATDNLPSRVPSTSVPDRRNIYGRDEDKKAIIKFLLDDNNNEGEEVSVLPIVGMGGVGKTTLAQMVYNDDNLNFDLKAWVCVSEIFDITKVTKTLIEAFTQQACEINDPNSLQEKLVEKLNGKKFLIILDDVWTEDYASLNDLQKPFQYGIKGSKIIVTTRSDKVASVVQTVQTYHLSILSNNDCWLVFANHARLSSRSGKNATALEKIGREIVKKCKGLPLAAQSLGGLLRRKDDIKDWNNVLNNDIWELSESECKIIPSLIISYHYLPPYLKRCFVHCSLYPKDSYLEKNDVIQLWMAEDLLTPQKKGKTLIEVGDEYIDYLVSTSFLQRSTTSEEGERYVMHDLMHDLATFIGGEFYFIQADHLQEETRISSKTRHLSSTNVCTGNSENAGFYNSATFLRTILNFNDKASLFLNNEEMCTVLLNVLLNLECLRVLSFHDFHKLAALPNFICGLIHLRYLNLSGTDIDSLSELLCNLYNLQTLKLEGCKKLTKLPNGMQNLVNLHYLGIDGTSIQEMPRGMSKLNKLQHLPYFKVGKHEEIKIKELGELSNLHGSFSIENLENVENGSEASEARMMNKKHIQHLKLRWSSVKDCTDSRIEMDILCKLESHQDLQSLEIQGYRGTRYPDWVGKPYYHSMTKIKLYGCNNCFTLPSLGHLPSLRELVISNFNALEMVDESFFNDNNNNNDGNGSLLTVVPFASLESVLFQQMPSWEVWSCREQPHAFPKLKWLRIEKCPKLKGDLPSALPALEELVIRDCRQLTCSDLLRVPALRKILIVGANTVTEWVFGAIIHKQLTCLESLHLKECSSAVSFPGDCLPASLKTLGIERCRKLEFPQPQQTQELLLESLDIHSSCDSLTSLPLELFPNLKSLSISDCENLESLLVSQSRDVALQKLYIYNCPKLVSLAHLVVSGSLPHQMNTLLPNLESLEIRDCPRMESFPEQGMLPGLREIVIGNCEKLLLSGGLSLASMDKLTYIKIEGPCEGIKSFPNINEGFLLPPSLKFLSLYKFSSVETLDCKGLLHLTHLQRLFIMNCPKLEKMAGELSLPPSLTELVIYYCHLLGEQCRTKHPHIWPKISHIQEIIVDPRGILSFQSIRRSASHDVHPMN